MLLETGLINHISSTYIFGRVAALALAGTWVGMSQSEASRYVPSCASVTVQFRLSLKWHFLLDSLLQYGI